MRSILLDESVPRGVAKMLEGPNIEVKHAPDVGLAGANDRDVLRATAALGVDVFVTCDQHLVGQNRIDGLTFGLVVVCTNNWPTILGNCGVVDSQCRGVRPGTYGEVLKGAHVNRCGRSPKLLDPS